ncbi:hypothetical protein QO002_005293 [Pararhizobium capsulatum DSM 1112]|uniref:Uncharacterized protein n=1 Tax=Pararhizobium capsulatum DSM 1112 TaxID=1121113 RepID=A0ABU0BYR7_9HYPH|nr:hypothetical protein [Pararhizobium capsulatum]MDQ0323087.1 hypothetical protein [Pararhizobium capsulatum DSM 1112]
MTDFQDIRIVELDDAASGPSESGPLMNMVLKLSADVPSDWREKFTETWGQGALAMRRAALVQGDTLTSTCMAYELQDQIDQLNEVISATNDIYRGILAEATARQDAELGDLKANLRYE